MAAVKIQVKKDDSKKVKRTKPREGKPNPDPKGRDVPQRRFGCAPRNTP